jgi:catechol 2,3-dioxygenase-like lactoylglutathione lyase family enzyme
MPAKGIHHVDLAVADLERSLAFYLMVLEPLGWREEVRYPTYRGTEEVVYLRDPHTGSMLGLRPAAKIHFPPEEDRDVAGYYALFVFDPDGMRVEVFSWPRDEL